MILPPFFKKLTYVSTSISNKWFDMEAFLGIGMREAFTILRPPRLPRSTSGIRDACTDVDFCRACLHLYLSTSHSCVHNNRNRRANHRNGIIQKHCWKAVGVWQPTENSVLHAFILFSCPNTAPALRSTNQQLLSVFLCREGQRVAQLWDDRTPLRTRRSLCSITSTAKRVVSLSPCGSLHTSRIQKSDLALRNGLGCETVHVCVTLARLKKISLFTLHIFYNCCYNYL